MLERLQGSPVRRIDFSGMGEPFQHPEFPDFLIKTLKFGFNVVVYTTGSGADSDKLDYIRKHAVDFPVAFYFTSMDPEKKQRESMIHEESSQLHRLFLDKILTPWSLSEVKVGEPPWGSTITRAGNLADTTTRVPAETPIACGKSWANVVMPNGDVITCCQDYSGENVFGNIFTENYESIRKGNAMQNFIARMAGVVEDPDLICRRCEHRYGVRHILSKS